MISPVASCRPHQSTSQACNKPQHKRPRAMMMTRDSKSQTSRWFEEDADGNAMCVPPELTISDVSTRSEEEGAYSPKSTLEVPLMDKKKSSTSKTTKHRKRVTWGGVHIRRHAIIPGDHPEPSGGGPPVSTTLTHWSWMYVVSISSSMTLVAHASSSSLLHFLPIYFHIRHSFPSVGNPCLNVRFP